MEPPILIDLNSFKSEHDIIKHELEQSSGALLTAADPATKPDTDNNIDKCGEVYRSGKGILCFICYHCGRSFDRSPDFAVHIEVHFDEIISIEKYHPFRGGVAKEESAPSTAPVIVHHINHYEDIQNNCVQCMVNNLPTCQCPSITSPVDAQPQIRCFVEETYAAPKKKRKNKLQAKDKDNQQPTDLKSKLFVCDICGKMFGTKNHIQQHMKIHSNAEKPYKCHVCGWEFRERGNLNRHIRTHSQMVKPFECDICGKTFSQKRYLNDHRRIHYDEKQFQCAVCGHGFLSSSMLNRHMMRHTGLKKYICEICSRSFARSDKLKEHRRVHTGEKPYACTLCTKSFSAKKSLRFHVYGHSGEKTFKCEYCELMFIHPGARRCHQKSVHQLMFQ